MNSIYTRVQKLIDLEGVSETRFIKSLGEPPSTYNSSKKRNSELGHKFLYKLKCKYPQLSLEWMITGEGEMWLDEKEQSESKETQTLNNDVLKQLKEVKSQNADLKKQAEKIRASYDEVESERKILFQALMGILPSKVVNIEAEKRAKVVGLLQSELGVVI